MYIAMRYVEGTDLRELLEAEPKLSLAPRRAHRRPGRLGARRGACARPRAPRRQAREHPARGRRPRLPLRLRGREGRRRAQPHAHRRVRRQRRVLRAGADRGPRRRRPGRPLCPRRASPTSASPASRRFTARPRSASCTPTCTTRRPTCATSATTSRRSVADVLKQAMARAPGRALRDGRRVRARARARRAERPPPGPGRPAPARAPARGLVAVRGARGRGARLRAPARHDEDDDHDDRRRTIVTVLRTVRVADAHALGRRAVRAPPVARLRRALSPTPERAYAALRTERPTDPYHGYINYDLGLALTRLGRCQRGAPLPAARGQAGAEGEAGPVGAQARREVLSTATRRSAATA